MCRKANFCTELGVDPRKWSRTALLPLPFWCDHELDLFVGVVQLASLRNEIAATSLLESIRGEQLRWWFCEHGQQSGLHRMRALAISSPIFEGPIDATPLKRFEDQVFARDGYRCRYCESRVIAKPVLSALQKTLGPEKFSATTNTNSKDHGVVLIFKAVADHVVPTNAGGRTEMANLVTSCQSCNYGKYNYTLEQLGLDDPRIRPPSPFSDWTGLTEYVPLLNRAA